MHPQARSPQADLQAYVAKVRAGADSAITQYFFNADAYFRFVDEALHARRDDPGGARHHAHHQLGRHHPLRRQLRAPRSRAGSACACRRFGDDTDSIKAFGLDVVRLCEQLRAGGAPGLHFYTMNQSAATLDLVRRLG